MTATTATINIGYTDQTALVQEKMSSRDLGFLRFARFKLTLVGTGTLAATNVVKLPGGRLVIFPGLCWFYADDMGASSVLDVGYAAYTVEDGDAVVAAGDRIVDGLSVASGPVEGRGANATNALAGALVVDTQTGLVITATISGGDGDASDVVEGVIVFGGGSPN